eukprot:TRINITY_DN1466_c0_g1_i1.p1 TRINITY_DN1466_c0_g1~~TRINITY_DN1466_c0_g1_i1.p1  ORF type:complete len:971 (+),score=291.84 TRINITY_DN1466_c0_g1_i1:469-3381(+)
MAGRRSPGFGLFLKQCKALLVKNATLAWRNKTATVLQLASSLFFMFLIWAVNEAIVAANSSSTTFKNLFTPKEKLISAIPECSLAAYIKTPCYDFLWSGKGNPIIESLVQNISINNPGRPIDINSKVLGFDTPADADDWLLANPFRVMGALHFTVRADGAVSFGVQTNTTARQVRGQYQDPTFLHMVPLQTAAEREIVRYTAKDWSIEWTPSYSEFAHPAVDKFSAVGSIGPTFLFAAAMFGFVIQMSNLVGERELKLRQALATMGMMDSAFWLTWLIWETFMAVISTVLLILFGMAFTFRFFLKNDFLVLFCMFFLFSLSMISVAFFVSTFVSKTSSANTIGFLIFIIGFVLQLVTAFGFPYSKSFSKVIQYVWSIFPPNLFAIGLSHLGDATATNTDNGIRFKDIGRCASQTSDCQISMQGIFQYLLVLFAIYYLLAVYCDNIFPDPNGVHKPLYYFLLPSFWAGRGGKLREGGGCCSCNQQLPPLEISGTVDEDVAEEEVLVKRQTQEGIPEKVAMSVQGLIKIFPGGCDCNCCSCKRRKSFQAVKGSWFNVERNSLFCLLGPNGAGKSTTINCLTGIIPTSGGEALIYGNSIRSASAMAKIRSFMGVCPQFDILWDSLTARDHLYLFANVKGLPHDQIVQESEKLLGQVRLLDAGRVRSGSYSGGMKRRLSLAISLIGDPQIVFLDEPTTGMDPVTRRQVWDIINEAKQGRAIILTTHSMEEADILGDRIAIMAKGRLRCIGTSLHLKQRFGAGYIITVGVVTASSINDLSKAAEVTSHMNAVKSFFKEHLDLDNSDETKGYVRYIIPRDRQDRLKGFFEELRRRRDSLGVTDLQLSLTTLEEVFLNIAREAELESAHTEGRYEVIQLSDLSVKLPVGAEFVFVPGTESEAAPHGMMVEVEWQQDDTGALKIGRHSDLTPAPRAPDVNEVQAAGGVHIYGKEVEGISLDLQGLHSQRSFRRQSFSR